MTAAAAPSDTPDTALRMPLRMPRNTSLRLSYPKNGRLLLGTTTNVSASLAPRTLHLSLSLHRAAASQRVAAPPPDRCDVITQVPAVAARATGECSRAMRVRGKQLERYQPRDAPALITLLIRLSPLPAMHPPRLQPPWLSMLVFQPSAAQSRPS